LEHSSSLVGSSAMTFSDGIDSLLEYSWIGSSFAQQGEHAVCSGLPEGKRGQVNPSQVRAPDQTKSHLEINKSNQQYSSPGANAFARREGGATGGSSRPEDTF
jgi:hypothetical protein